MLKFIQMKSLVEDAVSASILLGLCALIVSVPGRRIDDVSPGADAIQTGPPSSDVADPEINSVKVVASQGETNELAD